MFTRRGIDWTRLFKKIANDAFLINASSAIIDGEIVVPPPDGTTEFSVLQNELKGKSTSIVGSPSTCLISTDTTCGSCRLWGEDLT